MISPACTDPLVDRQECGGSPIATDVGEHRDCRRSADTADARRKSAGAVQQLAAGGDPASADAAGCSVETARLPPRICVARAAIGPTCIRFVEDSIAICAMTTAALS
jgi:hypothetical protein